MYGIDVPELPQAIQDRISTFLPKPGSSAINPVDVANPFVPPQALREVLLAAAQDDRIELQILVSLLYHYKTIAQAMKIPVSQVAPYRELADAVRDVMDKTGKPIVLVTPNPKKGIDDLDILETLVKTRQEFLDRGIPVYDEIHDAIRAIAHVNTYYEGRKK
jgi:hypothetical protein